MALLTYGYTYHGYTYFGQVLERDTGRVLVVEDNEFNMEVVRCMLENEGNQVALATNGQEACEAYQAAVERGEPFEVSACYSHSKYVMVSVRAGPVLAMAPLTTLRGDLH